MLDPDAIAQNYLQRAAAAAQRLDLGDGTQALGREILERITALREQDDKTII